MSNANSARRDRTVDSEIKLLLNTLSDKMDIFQLSLLDQQNSLNKHMEIEEIVMANIVESISELRVESREQRIRADEAIKETQIHFDDKIAECNTKVVSLLKDEHYNKDQVDNLARTIFEGHYKVYRDETTTALRAVEERVDRKAKLVAWVAATVMGIITTIAGLVIALYEAMKQ